MYSTRHANRCYKQDVFSSKVGEQFQFSEQADPEDPVQLASYFFIRQGKNYNICKSIIGENLILNVNVVIISHLCNRYYCSHNIAAAATATTLLLLLFIVLLHYL